MPVDHLVYMSLVSVGAAAFFTYVFLKDDLGYLQNRGIRPRHLLAITVVLIAAGRLSIIVSTPDRDSNIDLSVYREVGELVVNGVDPYDFSEQKELREKLKHNGVGVQEESVTNNYDYYVSSNLPASTALYGLIEFASDG